MSFRRIFSKRIRREEDGVQIAGDINAVVSANVGQRRSSTKVSSSQSSRVVQRSGKSQRRDEAEEAESE
jgi:hypothetical protein